jgi:hypothetical protein
VSEELKSVFDQYCIFFNIKCADETFGTEDGKESGSDNDNEGEGDVIEDSCDALKAVLKGERSILDSMEQALAEEESSFLGEEMFVTFFAGGETKDIVQF